MPAFTGTLPTFVCNQAYSDCVAGAQGNATAQRGCRDDIGSRCGTTEPESVVRSDSGDEQQTSSRTSSSTLVSTSTTSPSSTAPSSSADPAASDAAEASSPGTASDGDDDGLGIGAKAGIGVGAGLGGALVTPTRRCSVPPRFSCIPRTCRGYLPLLIILRHGIKDASPHCNPYSPILLDHPHHPRRISSCLLPRFG